MPRSTTTVTGELASSPLAWNSKADQKRQLQCERNRKVTLCPHCSGITRGPQRPKLIPHRDTSDGPGVSLGVFPT